MIRTTTAERTATRVLLIEDSPDDAELVKLELEQTGLAPECHRVDSEEALRTALLDQQWDIIISDFAMPGFNGLEAFRIVKGMGFDVPFIFVSGALGEERAVEAMRAGARDYLLKENLKRLGEAVRREIGEMESRRERRLVEKLARREARRLGMAVEASGAGIYEHGVPAGADSYFSERWAEILGFHRADLPPAEDVYDWFERRLHPEDRSRIRNIYGDFIAGRRRSFETEARVAHREGRWVWVALFCKPIERDPSGRATQVVGVMLDLTQRRSLEEQLRQAQKMESIGRLAGGVAHDFNNLLTVISSFGDFVLNELEEGSPASGDMREVLKAADRAAGLTAQLLAFSRRQTIEPRVLNLNELVSGIEKMLRRVLLENIDFDTSLSPRLGNVRVDPSAFEQVLLNLAINARDAMPEGGTLIIETANSDFDEPFSPRPGLELPSGRYVQVTVSDDGMGMDARTREQIFEPFFTTKELGKGTGLGLSTCYGIIKQAGGYVVVDSEVGRGTSMRVFLPRAAEQIDSVETRPAPPTLSGTETILIAEDDPQVRRLGVRVLTNRGYHVLEADDGVEALELARARQEPIDLLLTDMAMPRMGGQQLAGRLGRLHPEMKVLYTSGYASSTFDEKGDLDPDATLIQKPFRIEDLLRSVRMLLDQR